MGDLLARMKVLHYFTAREKAKGENRGRIPHDDFTLPLF